MKFLSGIKLNWVFIIMVLSTVIYVPLNSFYFKSDPSTLYLVTLIISSVCSVLTVIFVSLEIKRLLNLKNNQTGDEDEKKF